MRTLNTELISAFRHSAPYITMHRGQTFVFLLSAETIADRHIDCVISDIAILQSLGIKLVIVFGCKNQIDNALADAKVKTRFYKRIRIADTRSFSIIKRVCGDIQYNITAKLSMGLGNTPMHGLRLSVVSGNFVTAKPVGVIDGIDFCHSGTVRRVDAEGINFQLDRGNVVVLSPICVSVTGESFSLNSEDLASRVAIDLKANKFITFCPFQGILDDDGHVVPELFPDQAEEYLSKLDEELDFDRIFYKERWIKEDLSGRKLREGAKPLEQRLIVSFSLKYANYQRKIRQGQIDRANELIRSGRYKQRPKNQNDPHRFIGKNQMTEDGEACTHEDVLLDEDLIHEEEKYDGFYAVCTNLKDKSISEIVQINRKRWEIEESFRIMKADFRARPVYLRKEDRIKAHFLTCYIALMVFRILEKKLDEKYTCTDIIHTLKTMMMYRPGEKLGYLPAYTRTALTDALHETFGFRTHYEIVTDMNMKKIIRMTKTKPRKSRKISKKSNNI